MLSKEQIVEKLRTDNKSLIWALRVLNTRQTNDEQRSETTKYHNGLGFRPCHARMGTSMAQFYERRGFLSPKQIAYWRAPDKNGNMRISIYWKQIAEEVECRKNKQPAMSTPAVSDDQHEQFMNRVRNSQGV